MFSTSSPALSLFESLWFPPPTSPRLPNGPRRASISSDGGGAGVLELTTTSNTGTTLFIGDVPTGDVINFSFPEEGILFPKGIFCKTKTNIAAYTLLTDKYSGPGLTAG